MLMIMSMSMRRSRPVGPSHVEDGNRESYEAKPDMLLFSIPVRIVNTPTKNSAPGYENKITNRSLPVDPLCRS